MKGYMTPADHARQVAMVKASIAKRGPAPAGPARPEADMRRLAALRIAR